MVQELMGKYWSIGAVYVPLERLERNSFDRFHVNAGRIHRVAGSGLINQTELGYTLTPLILADTLAQEFPEVEEAI